MSRYRACIDVHLILRRGEQILLGQRRNNTGFAEGAWHLPSGHAEDGESATAALIREAAEEIGVTRCRRRRGRRVAAGRRGLAPAQRRGPHRPAVVFSTRQRWEKLALALLGREPVRTPVEMSDHVLAPILPRPPPCLLSTRSMAGHGSRTLTRRTRRRWVPEDDGTCLKWDGKAFICILEPWRRKPRDGHYGWLRSWESCPWPVIWQWVSRSSTACGPR
ncbi:MAG: NUDIX domain-containing protein [Pseudonocardiaceae bacterium]